MIRPGTVLRFSYSKTLYDDMRLEVRSRDHRRHVLWRSTMMVVSSFPKALGGQGKALVLSFSSSSGESMLGWIRGLNDAEKLT